MTLQQREMALVQLGFAQTLDRKAHRRRRARLLTLCPSQPCPRGSPPLPYPPLLPSWVSKLPLKLPLRRLAPADEYPTNSLTTERTKNRLSPVPWALALAIPSFVVPGEARA